MAFVGVLALLATCSAVFATPVPQESLDNSTLAKVKANLGTIATHSWEIGTELETLTELEWPELSVFHSTVPPPAQLPTPDTAADVIRKATAIVHNITSFSGPTPLTDGDGAVGDPASVAFTFLITSTPGLGVAVLLANRTRTNLSDNRLAEAAKNQLDYLLNVAPRTPDGAISHRADQVQLWADFVYMAPPFIAYYGAVVGGEYGASLFAEAYKQCKLYRQYLSDGSGLWQHIVLGSWQDTNHWGTGNGWAAAGMLRVFETIARSGHAWKFATELLDLGMWINEIVTHSWAFQHENGTLYNWIDQDAPSTFADSSSTALLGAVSFRLATITNNSSHIPSAHRALKVIKQSVNEDGWLLNTVNPLTFNTTSLPGQYSPEGQAFVLLLHAAWRDFEASRQL